MRVFKAGQVQIVGGIHQRAQQLLEGQPVVAESISIREPGNIYNHNSEVENELRVQPTNGSAFVGLAKPTPAAIEPSQ